MKPLYFKTIALCLFVLLFSRQEGEAQPQRDTTGGACQDTIWKREPQYRYDTRLQRYIKVHSALIPTHQMVQLYGGMGLVSFGVGWDYGRRNIGFAVGEIESARYYYGIAEYSVPEVMEHKLARFAELTRYPFDGFIFNLRSHKNGTDAMTRAQIRSLAEKLNVRDEDVVEMETRLNGHDIALETQHDDDDENFAPIAYLSSEQTEPTHILETRQNDRIQTEGLSEALEKLDPRSRRIIEARWLQNDNGSGATLHELAAEFGVSAERIRQIEAAALKKMKNILAAYS